MANVVRLHINGFTYTHATAASLDDPMVAGLVAALSANQLNNPQTQVSVNIKADAGTAKMVVYPPQVATFAAWVAADTTSTTGGTTGGGTGGTTVGVQVGL